MEPYCCDHCCRCNSMEMSVWVLKEIPPLGWLTFWKNEARIIFALSGNIIKTQQWWATTNENTSETKMLAGGMSGAQWNSIEGPRAQMNDFRVNVFCKTQIKIREKFFNRRPIIRELFLPLPLSQYSSCSRSGSLSISAISWTATFTSDASNGPTQMVYTDVYCAYLYDVQLISKECPQFLWMLAFCIHWKITLEVMAMVALVTMQFSQSHSKARWICWWISVHFRKERTKQHEVVTVAINSFRSHRLPVNPDARSENRITNYEICFAVRLYVNRAHTGHI